LPATGYGTRLRSAGRSSQPLNGPSSVVFDHTAATRSYAERVSPRWLASSPGGGGHPTILALARAGRQPLWSNSAWNSAGLQLHGSGPLVRRVLFALPVHHPHRPSSERCLQRFLWTFIGASRRRLVEGAGAGRLTVERYKLGVPTTDAADVRSAAVYVAEVLAPQITSGDWDGPAGGLSWDCRRTLAHAVDACNWYAALLARAGDGDLEVAEMSQDASPGVLLDCLVSGGAVLGAVVAAAEPGARGYHGLGSPDRTGYAAMGADEVLVHGWDIACRFDLEFAPREDVCAAVLQRIFPWAPDEQMAIHPWPTLLWVNGRTALGERPVLTSWGWWRRPLDEWDGRNAPTLDGDLRPCPRAHRFPGSAYRWRRGVALGRHQRLLAEEPLESVGLGGRGGCALHG